MNIPSISRYVIVLGGFFAALWLIGLLRFVDRVQGLHEPTDNQTTTTDAIVVLTGGSERLTAGLELLKSGKGKKLLVSGVHPGLTLDRLPVSKELYNCCITIGHEADNTRGNAEETLNWMREENFQSLRLVTANYHMPRSLLIFRAAMPDIQIIEHPVQPDSVILDHWWSHSGTASLLVTEYNKLLWASVRMGLTSQ